MFSVTVLFLNASCTDHASAGMRPAAEPGLAEVHQHAFSSGRDQGVPNCGSIKPAACARAGDFGDFGDAGFEILEVLLHCSCCGA